MFDAGRAAAAYLVRVSEHAPVLAVRQGTGPVHALTTTRFASRTVDTHTNTSRRQLGSNDWIRTVRGVGFRFDGVAALTS